MSVRISRADLEAKDRADRLGAFRDEFFLPDGVVYLDGNSLGALPKRTVARLDATVRDQWGVDLIGSWLAHDWIGLPRRVGDKIGRLIGAAEGQVIVSDSTSINLFKLLAAAVGLRQDRTIILTEDGNFPTDVYMAEGLLAFLDGTHLLRSVPRSDLVSALDGDTCVLYLSHVDYRTGAVHDLESLTAAAHAAGALVLWDLSHSAGALPLDLDGAGVDLAVGCGYKYLNGGPGAPSFLYVADRHQEAIAPVLSGWMGHGDPFLFEGSYRPAPGVQRHLVGTPPILSMVALEVGVDLFLETDMDAVRAKSVALTETFIQLVEQECGDQLELASPRDSSLRGSQVSFRHPGGYGMIQALIDRGVVGDFRVPDVLRFGFAPLYLRFVDLGEAVSILADIVDSRAWDEPRYRVRPAVT